jgi:hypothetical protein
MMTIDRQLLVMFFACSVNAFAGPVKADADGTIILKPDAGEISKGPLQVERKGHLPRNLGFWANAESTVSWTLEVGTAGNYAPSLVISCADGTAGSEVALMNGEVELTRFKVPATGTFKDFRVVDLLPVALPAGKVVFTVKPLSKPGGAVMDLRLLTLTPAP